MGERDDHHVVGDGRKRQCNRRRVRPGPVGRCGFWPWCDGNTPHGFKEHRDLWCLCLTHSDSCRHRGSSDPRGACPGDTATVAMSRVDGDTVTGPCACGLQRPAIRRPLPGSGLHKWVVVYGFPR